MPGVVVLQPREILTIIGHAVTLPNDRSAVNGGTVAGEKNITIPGSYEGREQAYIKHLLLEAYLEKLFHIIGMAATRTGVTELCYVDCFAGPWGDKSEDLSTTSIAISLRILDECRQELLRQGKTLRFRALYVEQKLERYARLERYLKDKTPSGIDASPRHGDFVELRQDILRWCGDKPFVFFFIDPTKWTPVAVECLKPLLRRSRSEFLINFMYDFVNRAASMSEYQEHMVELLGHLPDLTGLNSEEREQRILDAYRQSLKQCVPPSSRWPARSAYVRVLDRTKERPKYHLVYLTSHPRGIIEFMKISEELDPIQKRVRATTKQIDRVEKSGLLELFTPDQLPEEKGSTSIEDVERFWLQTLSREPKRIGRSEFADMLEQTDWFPSDLQRALGNLIKARKVVNLDDPDSRRRKNFLDYEKDGERLQLAEKAQ